MQLQALDWTIVAAFFIVALAIGVLVSRRAGRSSSEFFLSGRTMPWWLLGMSMVATTFSTDTPNLVTDIVRQNGVAGNWVWWAFLLTGMLTVFVYAKLWRRSGVTTDVEFYEVRYSGPSAAFLRGFRALYLGVFFNVMIMAAVTLAAIKIGGVMFGFSPLRTILIASIVTVIFSTLGGLRAVLLTDFLLFIIAMIGAVAAAVVAVNHEAVGGLSALLQHENVKDSLAIVPPLRDGAGALNLDVLVPLLIIPIAVQWWSVWYPGAEPGGGGYLAQRMLSAKDEKNAIGATLFFNAAHYALRPWPWIIVALASLVVFPDLDSIRTQFSDVDKIDEMLGHDLAYPAMLTFLPTGLLGLVVASLIAAYMSTISTHLNWGSSYVVNDFWARFINSDATEKEKVWVGRVSTVVLMVIAALFALALSNALQAFNILLQIGAGTGLLFILRWFWWRINALSELTAMVVSFLVAIYMQFFAPDGMADWQKLIIGVAITTVCWLIVTFITPASDRGTLRRFHRLTRPGGPGWKRIIEEARAEGDDITGDSNGRSNLPAGILCMVLGCFAVYCALFGVGYFIYGQAGVGSAMTIVSAVSIVSLIALWKRVATP